MQLSTRFSIAVHTLLCVGALAGSNKTTSDFIAQSVGVNPVTIRKALGSLKKAGLVEVVAGSGGASLAKAAEEISLLDVFQALHMVENKELFDFHNSPNPACPVGRSIEPLLGGCMQRAQEGLERELASVSLADMLAQIPGLAKFRAVMGAV